MAEKTHTRDEQKAVIEPGLKLEVSIADCLRVIEQQETQIGRLRLENVALTRLLSSERPGIEGAAQDGTSRTHTSAASNDPQEEEAT